MTPAPIELAREYASRPELWEYLVHHDPDQRTFELLRDDDEVTAWVICWMDDHDTGFHDHDVSRGAVAVVRGEVVEERLRLQGPPLERAVGPGESFDFEPDDIHRVRHAGGPPAVTIHVYSPPLRRQGAYLVEPDGRLRRQALSYIEELRPLESETPTPAV
jgi:predicted metal-dependent enzyme (double-stranded beta helix superfamily)